MEPASGAGVVTQATQVVSTGATASAAPSRAVQLRKQLYDKDAKLVDLFGDLEPKLMLDAIQDMFWAPCLHV